MGTRSFFWAPIWVQGPEVLVHSLLLSQTITRELDVKWSSQDQNGAHIGSGRSRWRVSLLSSCICPHRLGSVYRFLRFCALNVAVLSGEPFISDGSNLLGKLEPIYRSPCFLIEMKFTQGTISHLRCAI